jgi:hypothetical protein
MQGRKRLHPAGEPEEFNQILKSIRTKVWDDETHRLIDKECQVIVLEAPEHVKQWENLPISSLASMKEVEEFVVKNVEVDFSALHILPNLSVVKTTGVPIDLEQIGKCRGLRVLDIHGGHTNELLMTYLNLCSELERLSIKFVSIGHQDLTPLNNLERLRSIKYISCSLSSVILPSNPSLREIILDDNRLVAKYKTNYPEGLDLFQLRGCTSLSFIGLRKNPISNLDVSMFHEFGISPRIDVRDTGIQEVYVGSAKIMTKRLGLRRGPDGRYRTEYGGNRVTVKFDA